MSCDIYYWRQTVEFSMVPEHALEALLKGEPIGGIDTFPREFVCDVIRNSFPEIKDNGFELNWEGEGTYFQISFRTSPEKEVNLIIANCDDGIFEHEDVLDRLADACTSLGCALYDPQEGERYEQPEPSIKLEETYPNIYLLAFCIIMFLGSIITEVFTVGMFTKALQISKWPTVNATITRSEMDSKFHGKTSYTANIEYFFDLNGRRYSSSSIRTRGTSSQYQDDIAAVIKRFPVGKEVPAYYNSSDPSESYLEAGVGFANYVLIISPVVFSVIFGIFTFDGLGKTIRYSFRKSSGKRHRSPA
ncbi:MAG TPA: hypothetical protein DET40_08605 [Lentisphaeria bacterium]|nr:MAG: hypothetical protein A2X45_12205 [Lentisphaerae bacterium GWF2_50_93]HCE43595.1 hypothetical protein [Lentisphaeria bacterium]